jgi:hypothetical protein
MITHRIVEYDNCFPGKMSNPNTHKLDTHRRGKTQGSDTGEPASSRSTLATHEPLSQRSKPPSEICA